MDCPKCAGKMEPQVSRDEEVYRCFVCDYEVPRSLVRDRQRWWGRWHLPFIDIVLRPGIALRQLRANPAWLPTLILYLILLLKWGAILAVPRAFAFAGLRIQFLNPFSTPVFALAGLAMTTVSAWVVHRVGGFFANPAPFRVWWTVHVFLILVFSVIWWLAPGTPVVRWGFTLWQSAVLVYALKIAFRASPADLIAIVFFTILISVAFLLACLDSTQRHVLWSFYAHQLPHLRAPRR